MLHLGAGKNQLSGWLNTDLDPGGGNIYLDACEPFPFDDATFDFIFTEHMIEHVPLFRGEQMLGECLRVLKPGGAVRIATPDFRSLIDLYLRPDEPLHRAYLEWATRTHGEGGFEPAAIFVINTFVRSWSHSFIYDEHALSCVLRRCGFVGLRRREVGASGIEALRGLERHDRIIGVEFNRFETMVMEADKPDREGAAGESEG